MGSRGGFKVDVLKWEDGSTYPVKLNRETGEFSIDIDSDEGRFRGATLDEVKAAAVAYLKANLGLEWEPMISIRSRPDGYGQREHSIALEYTRGFVAKTKDGRLAVCSFKRYDLDDVRAEIGEKTSTYKFDGSNDYVVLPYTPERWSALRMISLAIVALGERIQAFLSPDKAEATLAEIAAKGAGNLLAGPAPKKAAGR